MNRFLLAAIFGLVLLTPLCAQKVSINKVDIEGGKIIVFYNLEDANTNHEYLLNLYSSNDNFTEPLKNVTGDIGAEVKPGTNKRVEWNMRQEYGGYKGRIALEIKGRVYTPFVKLQNFSTKKSYKRGKTYNITWKAGTNNPIHLELYKGNLRLDGAMNHPNNGIYTLNIPAKSKPGSDYRLKISDAKNSDEVAYTPYFKVAPKIPMLAKVIVPLAVVGGVVALLGSSSGGGESPPGENSLTEIELPTLPGN
ncbi:MAG: GPI anchored serine-threonine rich family protein [Cyclobacteriaceae bacterium]